MATILKKDGYNVSVVQEPETSFAEDVTATVDGFLYLDRARFHADFAADLSAAKADIHWGRNGQLLTAGPNAFASTILECYLARAKPPYCSYNTGWTVATLDPEKMVFTATLIDPGESALSSISVAAESAGKLWLGGLDTDRIGVISK